MLSGSGDRLGVRRHTSGLAPARRVITAKLDKNSLTSSTALMKDQVSGLERRGIKAAMLCDETSFQDAREVRLSLCE